VHRLSIIALTLLLPAGGAAPPTPVAAPFELHYEAADAVIAAAWQPLLEAGVDTVEGFFGEPYRQSFTIDVVPDRAAFTAWFPPEWGLGDTACWMVATGVDTRMAALTPRVWRDQACEHDPDDAVHVRNLLVHELVHVYHGQVHPSTDFDAPGIEEIGWFVEGLATYASGQLEERHGDAAREAIENDAAPSRLADGWTGPYRYGVSGSLVRHIDTTYGRQAILDLMVASDQEKLLQRLGLTEAELLRSWREAVLADN
jgi:hypothetical protein